MVRFEIRIPTETIHVPTEIVIELASIHPIMFGNSRERRDAIKKKARVQFLSELEQQFNMRYNDEWVSVSD